MKSVFIFLSGDLLFKYAVIHFALHDTFKSLKWHRKTVVLSSPVIKREMVKRMSFDAVKVGENCEKKR